MRIKRLTSNVRILNLVSGLAAQFITAVSGLVLPNLILHTYGSVLNGLVTTVTQMLAYLSLIEMGIMNASLVSLYRPMANADYDEASSVMAAINHYYHRIAGLFSAGAVVCGFLTVILIKDDIPAKTIWLVTLALAGTNFVSYWFLGKYKALLKADDKLYIVNSAHVIGVAVQLALSILVIRRNFNIAAVKAVIILTNLIECGLLYSYFRKRYPAINLKVTPQYDAIKQRKDVLVHQVLSLVLNHTDVILLTLFSSSLSSVSIYGIYNMVTTLLQNLANAVIGMFNSKMAQLYALQRLEDVRSILKKYELIYNAALFGLYICMAVLIMPFISVYTKGVTDAQYYEPAIGLFFPIYGIVRMLRLPYSELINSVGHFKQTKNQAIIEVLINLILSVALLPSLGIVGVLIGSIAGEVYRTIHTYYYCNVKLLTFDWIRSLVLFLLNSAVFAVFFVILGNYRSRILTSYGGFLILAVKTGVMVVPAVILSNLGVSAIYKLMNERNKV